MINELISGEEVLFIYDFFKKRDPSPKALAKGEDLMKEIK